MPVVICDPAKKRSHRHAILSELREQQEIAMADLRDPETKPQVRSMLMRAYVELQKQRNVERMKPAPKPVDVTERKPQRRRVQVQDHTPQALPPAPTQVPGETA